MEKKKFRVSIIAKVKHGDLRETLLRLGWTQSKAAKYLGMTPTRFGEIINLKLIPKNLTPEQEKKLLWMTEKLLDDLWPEWIRSKKKFLEAPKVVEIIREFTPQMLAEYGLLQLPPGPEEVLEKKELNSLMEWLLTTLSSREKKIIRGYFYDDKSLYDLAEELELTVERVRQIRNEALRKCRHPLRLRKIKAFAPSHPS